MILKRGNFDMNMAAPKKKKNSRIAPVLASIVEYSLEPLGYVRYNLNSVWF